MQNFAHSVGAVASWESPNGIFFRLTGWCTPKNTIPDTRTVHFSLPTLRDDKQTKYEEMQLFCLGENNPEIPTGR